MRTREHKKMNELRKWFLLLWDKAIDLGILEKFFLEMSLISPISYFFCIGTHYIHLYGDIG